MKRSLIVAVADNGVIGLGGDLPWRLPDDLKRFRKCTLGHAVVMGRRTWESLPNGALKKRLNIVISQRSGFEAEGALVAQSFEEACSLAESGTLAGEPVRGIMVIGGARLYAEALSTADALLVTHVRADVEGDVHFPDVDWAAWKELDRTAHTKDERHAYPFEFVIYERR
ncbi:MAG: dihydrofolate reductase [Sandaracinaceae bacterium]